MASFAFTYRTAPGTARTPQSAEAWRSWFGSMGDHLADIGRPGIETAVVGNCGPGTRLGGYSLITADDLDAALEIAKGCPAMTSGGGVEVAQLGEVPPPARETAGRAGTAGQAR
ncbi:MAG TPA: hypothetical protein VMG38_03755 [Trebonia sp.]|nr:hypothetical protein [Trebonia sp.]